MPNNNSTKKLDIYFVTWNYNAQCYCLGAYQIFRSRVSTEVGQGHRLAATIHELNSSLVHDAIWAIDNDLEQAIQLQEVISED